MSSGIKRIKGREYVYCTYYVDGKRHDVYCGPASDPDSQKRVLKVEIEHARRQGRRFNQKARDLEKQLRKMP